MRGIVYLLVMAAAAQTAPRAKVKSHICITDVRNGRERVVWQGERHFEAPNWAPDGKTLVLNSEGKLWKLPVSGGEPKQVDTGEVNRINNDHGVSPDGQLIVISAGPMYVLPWAGGTPKRITEKSPSYYHGWSPDGKTLVYCAPREKNFDIYAIAVEGGEEKRLTVHEGYDDGPDYTSDGKWIWFNSDRAGGWDLWRMPSSGAGEGDAKAERMTAEDRDDWFPHPSPDGKWVVFLAYPPGTKGHPANISVQLMKMPAGGGKATKIRDLFGGQGTINVNSWSPDSRRFAYVRYELVP
jgi:Tol biopolymer transport system component